MYFCLSFSSFYVPNSSITCAMRCGVSFLPRSLCFSDLFWLLYLFSHNFNRLLTLSVSYVDYCWPTKLMFTHFLIKWHTIQFFVLWFLKLANFRNLWLSQLWISCAKALVSLLEIWWQLFVAFASFSTDWLWLIFSAKFGLSH